MKNISKVRLSLCAQRLYTIYKKQHEPFAATSAFFIQNLTFYLAPWHDGLEA